EKEAGHAQPRRPAHRGHRHKQNGGRGKQHQVVEAGHGPLSIRRASLLSRSGGGSAISKSLSLEVAPDFRATLALGNPSAAASATRAASVARPSTARSWTASTSAGPFAPSCRPPTHAREAPGFTLTATTTTTTHSRIAAAGVRDLIIWQTRSFV